MAFLLNFFMRFLLVLFFLGMSTCLFACGCIFAPLGDAFRVSDFVGIGLVEKFHEQDPATKSKKVEFKVIKIFKGKEIDHFYFGFDNNNLCMGGDLEEGEEYLMYLPKENGRHITNLCLGRHFPVWHRYVMKRELEILEIVSQTRIDFSDTFLIESYKNDFFDKISVFKIPNPINDFGVYVVKYYSKYLLEIQTLTGFNTKADKQIESMIRRYIWYFDPWYDNKVNFPVTFLLVLRRYDSYGNLYSIGRYDSM